MVKPRSLLTFLVCAALLALSRVSPAADVVIGTGEAARLEFGVARAICRQIARADEASSCDVLRIDGGDAADPLAILTNVRNGAIELGIVTSDWQYYAYNGTGPVQFMDMRFENLRALFSLNSVSFTVIARGDAGIRTIDDLAGKRVNIGNPGSSQRAIMEMLMQARGWTADSFQYLDELNESEQSLALCHNRVQAVVAMVTHPSPAIGKTMELCGAQLVAVTGTSIDKLIDANPWLAHTEVASGSYAGMDRGVKTFGVRVTATSSADIDDETAYDIVAAVLEDLAAIKRSHRAFGNLEPKRMMSDGLSAPLHPGAQRYFEDAGLM